MAVAGSSQTSGRITLPAGVDGVAFGTAHRYKDATGKEQCSIVKPLAGPPLFSRGVTELSYAVMLKPRVVQSASTQVISPADQQLRGLSCNVFTPVKGGFSQTQLGNTIARIDKAPLASGTYKLRITVDGQVAEVPFTVK